MKPIYVGLLGCGTVGSGTFFVLKRNQHEIERRVGRRIEITHIAARNPEKVIELLSDQIGQVELTTDFHYVVDHSEIDIVAEMIGGTTLARELVLRAIDQGKHVVTANKALLAEHGNEIFAAAAKKGVMVVYEAAVAGGVPIIKALRESLSANRIRYIAGIINGTTNYILSEMRQKKIDFETALKDAQKLGYAEADPTFDIEGIDAAHKLSLLCALAFGVPVQFDKAFIEGITALKPIDIQYAEELGYRIKLLGITRLAESGIELRVHPTLIPKKRLLANVEGAMNAILVDGDASGLTLYYGKGAGAEATASAVVADLVDVARLDSAPFAYRVPYLAFQAERLSNIPILSIDESTCGYYLRLRVVDVTGVLADITRILAQYDISIDALLQKESEEIDSNASETDIILISHLTQEKKMNAAIAEIENLSTVLSKVTKLRMEDLT